mmetsp:Transcript_3950/g.11441  ORF Transcript_3950/g.11441 Transcript_3950/m.11441 type:complete len:340 (-) Transcript_3950:12-1031(-)
MLRCGEELRDLRRVRALLPQRAALEERAHVHGRSREVLCERAVSPEHVAAQGPAHVHELLLLRMQEPCLRCDSDIAALDVEFERVKKAARDVKIPPEGHALEVLRQGCHLSEGVTQSPKLGCLERELHLPLVLPPRAGRPRVPPIRPAGQLDTQPLSKLRDLRQHMLLHARHVQYEGLAGEVVRGGPPDRERDALLQPELDRLTGAGRKLTDDRAPCELNGDGRELPWLPGAQLHIDDSIWEVRVNPGEEALHEVASCGQALGTVDARRPTRRGRRCTERLQRAAERLPDAARRSAQRRPVSRAAPRAWHVLGRDALTHGRLPCCSVQPPRCPSAQTAS